MWNRVELKYMAKEVLKTKYWKSFFISLVLVFVSAEGSGNASSSGATADRIFEKYPLSDYYIIIFALGILAIAFRILLGYGLEVGSRKYFIESGQYKDDSGTYSFAFDSENFKGIISTMFRRGIYVFLWSLLLIIPGIIKSYEYRMVPYLLADNPNLGSVEAITLSRDMMDGEKFNLFVLELSFIGWYILGALALGIGVFFVNPYYNATETQFYLALRGIALDRGYCTYEDLNLDPYY